MKRLILALLLSVALASPGFAAALTASCIWSVLPSGSTNNGGMFDPSQTAGMATGLASTSSSSTTPSFSSASYNFTVSDENNWVFVGAGSGWQTGFYKITGNSGNSAVIDAAIGHVILYNTTTGAISLSTVAGCGATTGGTWAVDYAGPGQTADSVTNSTFASAGSSTTLTDGSSIFTPAMVGNAVHITNTGTGGFGVLGWYTITAYGSATSVTVNVTTNTGTAMVAGTGFIGGAVALLDNINSASAGLGPVAGNQIFLSGSFTQANTVTWVVVGTATSPVKIQGYLTYWGDVATNFSRTNGSGAIVTTNMPLLTFASTKTLISSSGVFTIWDWLNITGNEAGTLFTPGASDLITRNVITNVDANAASVVLSSGGALLFNNDFLETGATTATTGIAAAGSVGVIMANRIVISSPTGNGATVSGAGPVFINNQFIGAGRGTATAGAGIVTTAAAGRIMAVANSIVGFYDDVNIINTPSTAFNFLVGNMLTDAANYGLNATTTANSVASLYNRTGNNVAGAQGSAGTWLAFTNYGEVTSWTTSDYQSVTTDLRLLSGSPAVGAAFFPNASIGALQLSAVAGVQTSSAYAQ